MSPLARLTEDGLDATDGVEVRACPGGPWLVRGAAAVEDADGAHEVTRPVVAVCSCDKSQRLPWCDGTHKVIPRTASR
jgi:CDGSH-type Zn-finger protein